jgi:hypothetical protein
MPLFSRAWNGCDPAAVSMKGEDVLSALAAARVGDDEAETTRLERGHRNICPVAISRGVDVDGNDPLAWLHDESAAAGGNAFDWIPPDLRLAGLALAVRTLWKCLETVPGQDVGRVPARFDDGGCEGEGQLLQLVLRHPL